MSVLILGTANFGVEYKGRKVQDPHGVLGLAAVAGMAVETARAYGVAERIVGEWGESNGYPSLIIGKGNSLFEKRLSERILGKIDIYLAHSGECFDPSIHDGLSAYERTDDDSDAKIVEVPLSILDQRWMSVPTTSPSRRLVRSIFARGAVFERPALKRIAADTGFSIVELCLGFVRHHKPAGIVVGVDSVAQLDEIMAARPLPAEVLPELAKLDERLDLRAGR